VVTVKVRSIALVRHLLGQDPLDLEVPDGATVADVLARLAEIGGPRLEPILAEPKEKSAHAPLRVMVNGRDIHVLQDRETPVAEGDDILVFVPIAGG
jgi:molybdopterin converting factor small subunit